MSRNINSTTSAVKMGFLLNHPSWNRDMVQQVRALATKLEDISLIPGTHTWYKDKNKADKLSSDLQIHVLA